MSDDNEEKTGKEKFDELLQIMVQKKPKPEIGGMPSKDLGSLGKLLAFGKYGGATKTVGPHYSLASIVSANAAALIVMPATAVEDWLVQVFPDVDGYIHFQAKSSTHTPAGAYTRWYVKAPDVTAYDAVAAAFNAEGAVQRKSFFYDSEKPYLVCKRVNETTVYIPGYGEFEVPQLFGLNLSSEQSKVQEAENPILDAEIVEDDFPEENEDDED